MGKSAAAEKSATTAYIQGVDASKVNAKTMRAAAKLYKVDVDKGAAPEALILGLARYFKEAGNDTPDDPHCLLQCDDCKAFSFEECPECPFCGAGDDVDSEGKERPSVPSLLSGTGGPLVKVQDDLRKSRDIVTQRQLDEAVAKVHAAKGETAVSYYRLGVAVREIYDRGIWQLRVDDKGKPRWKGFDAFVHHELGMLPGQAFQAMDVTRNYSEAQVLAWGRTKLSLIMQAPEDKHPELEAMLEGGASKREIEAEVRKAKKESGHQRSNRRSDREQSPEAAANMGKGAGRPLEKITIAATVSKQRIKLYAAAVLTPKQRRGDLEEAKRAKRFADKPFGREELSNGVVQYFYLQENSVGEWDLVIDRVREDK
jgi:hypothetical protein